MDFEDGSSRFFCHTISGISDGFQDHLDDI